MSITFRSDFGYLELIRRYSRSKSKVVVANTQILNFHDKKFLGDPHPHLGVRYQDFVNV